MSEIKKKILNDSHHQIKENPKRTPGEVLPYIQEANNGDVLLGRIFTTGLTIMDSHFQ